MPACSTTLDNHDVCRIAAAADCDHRTVEAFLAGAASQRRSRQRSRIANVMRQLGFDDHIPVMPGLAKG